MREYVVLEARQRWSPFGEGDVADRMGEGSERSLQ